LPITGRLNKNRVSVSVVVIYPLLLLYYCYWLGDRNCKKTACKVLLHYSSKVQGGCFVLLSFCPSVCLVDYLQSYERILMKFFGGVGRGPTNS